MPFGLSLNLLVFITTFIPSSVIARGGRGGGRGGSVSVDSSFSLSGIYAAIFSFCVIFAVFTLVQAISALKNIRKRMNENPPSITLPEFNVGAIFRTTLFILTLSMLTDYVLHGLFVAFIYNDSATSMPPITLDFVRGWYFVGYFADFLLLSMLFALIWCRERVHFEGVGASVGKRAVDVVLVCLVVGLGMGIVGSMGPRSAITGSLDNIYYAYVAFFCVASLDVAVSSIMLYNRIKRSPVNDHNIALINAFVVSPMLLIYAIYPICSVIARATSSVFISGELELASIIVYGTTRFIIVAVCLTFGMPPKLKSAEKDQGKDQEA